MYLVLRPPWGGHGTAPMDGSTVSMASSDAGSGSAKPKKKRSRHKPSPNGPQVPGANDDEQWAGQGDVEETEGPAPVVLTAADRAMEWRGDDVSPPPRKLDMTNDARALDDGEIQRTINSQSAGAQNCVVSSAPNAVLTGTITVKMVVEADGHVSRSKVQAPHVLFEKGLLPCMKGAIGRMKFPATGMPTLVTMPINLT
jgi:hypothetical protein